MREMLTKLGFHHRVGPRVRPERYPGFAPPHRRGRTADPNIFLAGSIFPEGGHPVYLPAEMKLPETATPDEAAQMARDYLGMGLDWH